MSSHDERRQQPARANKTLPHTGFNAGRLLRRLLIGGVVITICYTLLASQFGSSASHGSQSAKALSASDLERLRVLARSDNSSTTRRLRIFMPADSPHINLCKTIMSGVALGYPMPVLLNWKGEYNRPEWHFGGSHIAKLTSLLAAVDTLSSSKDGVKGDVSDDDLVVLMDAYDIWFQLPPAVLIERYHQLNREADARMRAQWDAFGWTGDFPIPPPRQDIIVTTAKHCFPEKSSGSDAHYEYWPESPMPSDMYGPGTDQVSFSFDAARKHRKVRPRCINSGLIIGSLGGMRNALRRAHEKADRVAATGRQLWSDQALFAEVVGDQEIWREWVRRLGSGWDGKKAVLDPSAGVPSELRSIAEAALAGKRFEFGIGLDYNFTTAPPTCSAEEDGFFVTLGNQDEVASESKKAGVPGPVRVHGAPPELVGKQSATAKGQLADVNWADVPLYTDFYFGVTPVAIHHNAYSNGMKPWRLKNWWDKMWFYPTLRERVTRRLQAHDGSDKKKKEGADQPEPLVRLSAASVGESRGGEDVEYWAPELDRRGHPSVRVFDASLKGDDILAPLSWDGVCQKPGKKKWYDELFGDGKGPLKL